ncbi:hypothetical protein Bbelb_218880 [Branchiostoma belcheri]|nr:hypothetical protein Bbelb_218880 [Branchiostoma belcheri]
MRPFLLAAFVIVFVGSFADAFWGSSSSGKKGSNCNSSWPWLRRKCDDDNVEDDQPEKIDQDGIKDNRKPNPKGWFSGSKNKRKGEDGKKCSDQDGIKGNRKPNPKGWPWFSGSMNKRKGEDGKKCKRSDQDGIKGYRKPNPKGWPWFSGSMNKRKGEDGKKCKRSEETGRQEDIESNTMRTYGDGLLWKK